MKMPDTEDTRMWRQSRANIPSTEIPGTFASQSLSFSLVERIAELPVNS